MTFSAPPSINIASQPFRRERAQNAVYAVICAALLGSLLVLVSLIFHARAQAAGLRRIIASENAELRSLERQDTQFSAVLSKPENADVFSTSVFLNEVIARRGVSWTRVFKDVGTVLPQDMQLMQIRLPQVAAQEASATNHVELDMVVASARPDAVIDLLLRLQKSSLFGPAQVTAQQPPTQNDRFYKYRVTVAYAQKL